MQKFGKINFFGNLELANNIIQTNEKIIVNPTEEEYLDPKEGFNIAKRFNETDSEIIITYEYEQILEEEIIDSDF